MTMILDPNIIFRLCKIVLLCAAAKNAGVQLKENNDPEDLYYGKDDIPAQEEIKSYCSWLQSKNADC